MDNIAHKRGNRLLKFKLILNFKKPYAVGSKIKTFKIKTNRVSIEL